MSSSTTKTRAAECGLRQAWLEGVRSQNLRPFLSQTVESAWDDVIDSPSLRRSLKAEIKTLLATTEAGTAVAPVMTVVGPPGFGKTHLLSWTRSWMQEQHPQSLFVEVPPFRATTSGALENHVLVHLLDTLERLAPERQVELETRLLSIAADEYDRFMNTRRSGELALEGISKIWPAKKTISHLPVEEQCEPVRKALVGGSMGFRKSIRRVLTQRCPRSRRQRMPAPDTLLAFLWLAVGDETEVWDARRWLHGELIESDRMEALGFNRDCRDIDRCVRAVETIQSLIDAPLCLAFDQLEETVTSFGRQSPDRQHSDYNAFSEALRTFRSIDRVSFLFMFQQSSWTDFQRKAPGFIARRMRERGVQMLEEISESEALDVVQHRLRKAVWDKLDVDVPQESHLFPFTRAEVSERLMDANGILGDFLLSLQSAWEAHADPTRPQDAENTQAPGPTSRTTPFCGATLRALRKKSDHTQRTLAGCVGVSASQIGRLERGQAKTPSAEMVAKLATALKAAPADFAST